MCLAGLDGLWLSSPVVPAHGHAVAEVLGLCPRDDRQKITRLINQLVKRGNLKTCEKKDAKGNARKFLEVGKAPAEGGEDAPSIM